MANLLFSKAVEEVYKEVSEVISTTDVNKKTVRKMSLKEMMQESVFHGASWIGENFIA